MITRRDFTAGLALGAAAACGRVATGAAMQKQPTGFVAHGAPLLALDGDKGAPLRAWGAAMPRPRSILVLSAHWEERPPTLGATSTVPLVYDFYGFPEEMYALTYAAPGAPELAKRVEELLPKTQRNPTRGLDHGAWVPLLHMFPRADVPVLQLSLPGSDDPKELFALGRALAPLRDEGVFILGSGNITHNLRRVDWHGNRTPAWAADFDAWTDETLTKWNVDALLDYQARAPGFRESLPTQEHFVPLIVAAGAAGEAPRIGYPVSGFEYGSLSRRSVELA
jgi:4,5-DOPA dioxygenase extradiol